MMTWLLLAIQDLPEGNAGIASKFVGDAGIEGHPAVVFSDNFETGRCKAENSWGGVGFSKQRENVNGGTTSMELALVRPSPKPEQGLGFQHSFKDGFDTLFLRYYAKFAKDMELFHGGSHDGGSIFARAPGVPDAKPGIPADGKNEYTALLDTWRPDEQVASPGNIAIYCYHPEQRHQYGEHFFPSGKMLPFGRPVGTYFGPTFVPRPEYVPERGRWTCYELMVKANAPGKRDGRIAIWVDGKIAADFPNLRLRDVDTLKANRISIGLYTQNSKVTKTCTMWFDDVVAATSYIGPIGTGRAAAKEKPLQPTPGGKSASPFSKDFK